MGIEQYRGGLRYVLGYARYYGAIAFALALVPLLRRRREHWVEVFALQAAVYLLYIVYVGGDGLGFFRFVVFIAPFIYLLLQEGLLDVVHLLRRSPVGASGQLPAGIGVLALTALLGCSSWQTIPVLVAPASQRWHEPQSGLSFPGTGADHRYVWFDNYFAARLAIAARWLDAHTPPDTLIASTPAGAIGYYTQRPILDMLGLNDLTIAHGSGAFRNASGSLRPGHEKGDGKYVLSRSPQVILMGNVAVFPYPVGESQMAEKLVLKSEHELWDAPEFHARYELVCVHLAERGVFRYFSFFKRRDFALNHADGVMVGSACGG